MKGLTIFGVVLIILGILGFIFGGFSFTTKEKVADIGPIEIESKDKETVPVTPIASGVAVIAGIVLVAVGAKKN